jgi:hypothetical protein
MVDFDMDNTVKTIVPEGMSASELRRVVDMLSMTKFLGRTDTIEVFITTNHMEYSISVSDIEDYRNELYRREGII